MWARYDYAASSTLANVQADVIAVLTGTTDKTTLSAACVQASTSIISTVAAGWSVYDASAGTNRQVLRALCADGTTYKYVLLDFATSGQLRMEVYESWNSGTHTGTNRCALAASTTPTVNQTISLTSGGTLFLMASNRYMGILGWVGGLYGGTLPASNTDPMLVCERTRDNVWDTTANGVVPVVFCDSRAFNLGSAVSVTGSYCYAPRKKSSAGADATGLNANYYLTNLFGQCSIAESGIPRTIIRGYSTDLVTRVNYLMSVQACKADDGDLGGKLYGVYLTTNNFGSIADEVVNGSDTYFVMSANSSGRIVLPKF